MNDDYITVPEKGWLRVGTSKENCDLLSLYVGTQDTIYIVHIVNTHVHRFISCIKWVYVQW